MGGVHLLFTVYGSISFSIESITVKSVYELY